MNKKFSLDLFEGHPIIKDGDNTILIDTGNPSTIHDNNQLFFCGKGYDVATSHMGLTIQKLSKMLGKNITTLLGADVLKDFKILFNYQSKEIFFCDDNDVIAESFNQLPVHFFMGIPIVEIGVTGQSLYCFMDSGAKLSYIDSNITAQYPTIGIEQDFYPGYGMFETNAYIVDTSIGNSSISIRYGNLPFLLQMALMMANTQGIIGYDFFNSFKIVLDYRKGVLYYG
jgi:hypothetical protein